jgi:hypothetical protein
VQSDPTLTTNRVVASGLLSESAGFRLIVSGKYGARQINTIVQHLVVTRDALLHDEVEDIEADADWAE